RSGIAHAGDRWCVSGGVGARCPGSARRRVRSPTFGNQGLVQRVPLNENERAVTLTNEGRWVLERHRDNHAGHRQAFYSGADKARERSHDAHLYRAYLKAAERLQAREVRILRVELDRELKREYQRFLQERNRGDRDNDGRPDRTPEEIQEWAKEHELPYFDDQVH